MIKKILTVFVSLAMSVTLLSVTTQAQEIDSKETSVEETEGRTVLNFNNDWGFYQGDLEGAQSADYDDSEFIAVSVPHTMRLEKKHTAGPGVYQGIGWYRRYFTVDEQNRGKHINIDFECVMIDSDVYLNGEKIYTRHGGYTGFSIDISDIVKYGEENVLALRVSSENSPNTPPGKPLQSLDFHYFGGIYRDVTMTITEDVHVSETLQANQVAGGGVFVTYEDVSEQAAKMNVKTNVENTSAKAQDIHVVNKLVDAQGNQVQTSNSDSKNMSENSNTDFTQSLNIDSPHLWSTEDPYLYTLVTEVYSGDTLKDSLETRVGIRSIDFKPDGFYLNGKKEYLRGGNRHQAYQNIGDAASNSMQYRDAMQIKENGFNSVRTGHYPQDPEFLKACDELGILVIEPQPGWQYFNNTPEFINNTMRDIQEMIRRDRNHPSIIAYEVTLNETPAGNDWTKRAVTTARAEYPGDQLKLVADYNAFNATLYDVLYKVQYKDAGKDEIRDQDPNMPFLTREWGDIGGRESSLRDQGESAMLYQVSERQKYLNGDGYNDWGGLDYSPRIAGHYLWSWNDYSRGSNGRTLGSGTVDIDRNEKYGYYWLRSMQPASRQDYGPMVYVASTNSESSNRNIQVYSNADSVSLYQNGKLIGTQTREDARIEGVNDKIMDKNGSPIFMFKLPSFEAGELKAVATYQGKTVEHSVYTPGEAHHIEVEPVLRGINPIADGSDQIPVYFKVVDENGTVIPNYKGEISLAVEGQGSLIGANIPRIKVETQTPESGIGFAYVRVSNTAGDIKISASADGLSGSTVVTTQPYTGEFVPSVANKEWSTQGEEKFEKAPGESDNLAYGKTITASSSQTSQGNIPENAIDDEAYTKWVADGGNFPQWLQVDLGKSYDIGEFNISWETTDAIVKYTIETSNDGVNWKTRVDNSSNATSPDGANKHKVKLNARYVRLNISGMGSYGWASVSEFVMKALPEGEEVLPGNIITNDAIKSISATSQSVGREAELLRDGDTFVDTGWLAKAGEPTPQAVTIEFNAPQDIQGNRIYWQKDSTFYTYNLEFSKDGETWETAFENYEVGGQHYLPEEFTEAFTDILFARITLVDVKESSGNPSTVIGMAEWILYGDPSPVVEFKETEYLSDLTWESAKAGYGEPTRDNVKGKKISLMVDGKVQSFDKGLFAEANSKFIYNLEGMNAKTFETYAGIDHAAANKGGRVTFKVLLDGKEIHKTKPLMAKNESEFISVDVTGGKELTLLATYTQNPDTPEDIEWQYNGWAVWADAKVNKDMTELVSVENPSDIYVPFGTNYKSIEGLPKSVNATFDKIEQPTAIKVDWDFSNYDELTSGTYTISGTLVMPNGAKNSKDIKANLTIHVKTDTSKLEDAIKDYESKDFDQYTEESLDAFNKVLSEAKDLVSKNEISEQDVNDMLAALDTAFNQLVDKDTTKPSDKTELSKLVLEMESVDLSKYTEESANSFSSKLAQARTVLSQEDASQESIDQAIKDLSLAHKQLVLKDEVVLVDKQELNSLIVVANKLDLTKYQEEGINAFSKALADAKLVFDHTSATQDEVDQASASLTKAMKDLKPIDAQTGVDKTELDALIKKVQELDLSKYSSDSSTKLKTALSHAVGVSIDVDATQEEVNLAMTELQNALDNLVANSDATIKENPSTGIQTSTSLWIGLGLITVATITVLTKKKKEVQE